MVVPMSSQGVPPELRVVVCDSDAEPTTSGGKRHLRFLDPESERQSEVRHPAC